MDKKSKFLLVIFVLVVIVSISISFYGYIYLEDINFFIDSKSIPNSLDVIKNFLKI